MYGNETFTTTLGTPFSQYASNLASNNLTGNVEIVGDFYIDINFTFSDCIIKITPGVKIIILTTQKAVFLDSKLFACDNLWEGIWVAYESRLEVIQSEIEDAQKAILAPFKSDLIVRKTIFNRNYIGMEINFDGTFLDFPIDFPYPLPSWPPDHQVTTFFQQNIFRCTESLNGTVDDVGYAGIRKRGWNFYSGGIFGNSISKFEDIQYGIYSSWGTTVIHHYDFKNILIAGIYKDIGAALQVKSCKFKNCIGSIRGDKIHDLSVLNCSFNYDDVISATPSNLIEGIVIDEVVYGYDNEIKILNNSFNADFIDQYSVQVFWCTQSLRLFSDTQNSVEQLT